MDRFRYLRFLFVCHAFLSVPVSLVITCLERADLFALLYVTFSCVCVTFPCRGVLHVGQVWYFIVSIPDLCRLPYIHTIIDIFLIVVKNHSQRVFVEFYQSPLI